MDENRLLKSLQRDVLAVFKKHNIEFDRNFPLLDFKMRNERTKSVIEFGEAYDIYECVISIKYRQTGCLMTAEDEYVFVNSIHPKYPNMRKEVDYISGEKTITVDGIPVRRRRSLMDKILGILPGRRESNK